MTELTHCDGDQLKPENIYCLALALLKKKKSWLTSEAGMTWDGAIADTVSGPRT